MKPRLLDLFCCAGGAAKGYQRAGFYVVGVDIKAQPHYCGDEFIQGDALEYVEAHGQWFDAIHASPPCQGYTPMTNRHPSSEPRLVEATRLALERTGKPFVIENVPGAPVRRGLRLCGSSFGLPIHRHRLFESSELLLSAGVCDADAPDLAVYGPPDGRRLWTRKDRTELRAWNGIDSGRQALGVPWMQDWREVREAIPPAYTEFIGRQLIAAIGD